MTSPYRHRLSRSFGLELVAGALRLLGIVLLARALGDAGYGAFAVLTGITILVFNASCLGLPSAATYFGARAPGRAVAQRLLVMAAIASSIGAVVASPFVAAYLSALSDGPSGVAAAIALMTVIPYTVENVGLGLLRGLGHLPAAGLAAIARHLGIVAVAALVGLARWDATAALGGALAVSLLVGLTLAVRARHLAASVETATTAPTGPDLLRYGASTQASTLVAFLGYRIDLLLVAVMLGPADAGIYAAAVGVVEMLWFFSQVASGGLLGEVARSSDDVRRWRVVEATARLVVGATVVAGAVLAVASPVALDVLFGGGFRRGWPVVCVSLIGVVPLALSRVLATHRAAIGRPKDNLPGSIVGLIANTAFTVAFIPLWGLTGAAAATAIAYTIIAVERTWAYRKEAGANRRVRLLVPRREDLALVRSAVSRAQAAG